MHSLGASVDTVLSLLLLLLLGGDVVGPFKARRSVGMAPHMDGIYYDGINFDRLSMRRVRSVVWRC